MRICIPILENKFLESEVSGHFGKAPGYLVIESGSRAVESVIDRKGRGIREGTPVEVMVDRGVEAVACHGLGEGAQRRLTSAGIRIFQTGKETVEEILWELEYALLEDVKPEDLHKGHHNHDNRNDD